MLLVIRTGKDVGWYDGYQAIERQALPNWELHDKHLETFKEYWYGTYGPANSPGFKNLGGFDVTEFEMVSADNPNATDDELRYGDAINTLDNYGVLKAMGFEDREDYR